MKTSYFSLVVIVLFCCSYTPQETSSQNSCEWCGATEAPSDTKSHTIIADKNEDGSRISISGTVYLADRITPARNVILYLYHTNSKGVYPKKGNETGNGKRHGYLRGWVKTGNDGKYSFDTIKPEPYPGRTIPAHIHITVKEPDKKEYWLKDFYFEGDDLLPPSDITNKTGESRFNHVIELTPQEELLVGKRDILLKD